MSAPSRVTAQSYPPQGCGLRRRTTSPRLTSRMASPPGRRDRWAEGPPSATALAARPDSG
jgi:hypothetical protein